MDKLVILTSIILLLTSCNSDEAQMRKALKDSIPEELRKEYKYNSHNVVETILKSNLQDSIARKTITLEMLQSRAADDSTLIKQYRSAIDDCKREKANTLYFLRSSYDSIIRQYEDMLSDAQETLDGHNKEIDEINGSILFWKHEIEEATDIIVFYKVRHLYKIKGKVVDKIVTLNSKYELIN